MGAKTFTELIAWQAANRFKIEVYRLTARTGVEKDFDFCNQIRRSSSSVSSNLAEGFARYGHRDFARFVAIARASLIETQNHLIDATDRGHIQEGEFKALWQLSNDALAAVTGLLKYLQGTNAKTKGRHRT